MHVRHNSPSSQYVQRIDNDTILTLADTKGMILMSQITCPNCNTPIKAEHINVHKLVAVCPKCSRVFSIEPQIGGAVNYLSKHDKVKRPEIFEVEESHDRFQVSYPWRKGADRWLMVVLGIFLFIPGVLFSLIGFSDAAPVPLQLLGVAFVLSALYIALITWSNRSILSLNQDDLQVVGTPLYFPLVNHHCKLSEIERFKTVPTGLNTDPEQDLHTVFAYKRKGGRVRLMAGLSFDQALYVAQQLNYYLEQAERESILDEAEGETLEMTSTPSIRLEADGEIAPLSDEIPPQQIARQSR